MKFTYEGTFQTGVNSDLYKTNFDLIFRKAPTPTTSESSSTDSDPSVQEGNLANPR